MERGFGWHYPPGTPGPRTTFGKATCEEGHRYDATCHEELGSVEIEPDCDECGSEAIAFEPHDEYDDPALD